MFRQIHNIISKVLDLRKGLLGVAVLSMLISGFVIGSGVRVEAAVTGGFKVTGVEELNNSDGKCIATIAGQDGSNNPKIFALGENGVLDVSKLTNCVYGRLGNIQGKSGKVEVKLSGCEISEKLSGRDLFCSKAIDLADGVTSYKPTHWKFDKSSCPDSVDRINETFFCTTKQYEGNNKGKQCYGNVELNKFVICDADENGIRPNAKENTAGSVEFKDNGWTCGVEVESDGNNRGTYRGWKCIKDDGGLIVDSTEADNVCNLFNFTGSTLPELNCRATKIKFSNGTSKFWIQSGVGLDANASGLFKAEKPDKSYATLEKKELFEACKFTTTTPKTIYFDTFQKGSPESDCSGVTKEQFFDTLKAICDTQSAKAGCNSKPGESGDRVGGSSSDAAQKAAEDKAKGGDNPFGGLFTIIYQVVAAIIMALLFLVRYLQMEILLLFISVMTVLLNLSPNTGFLTTLAVPLWSIFAQIASLGAVGILIFLGSATMIGIEGFEYDKTIAKGAKVAIYVFVSNFTYFGLAFAISLLDGFTKLIVFVFGGGSVFKLFEALIASVSSVSKISSNGQSGNNLIPDFTGGFKAITGVFGKGAGDVTTLLVSEIIVVIGLGLIIWVFGRIFFMLLTRVAILLLLLITSPIWVLGILVKDSLPSQLQGQVDKAVSLVGGTIVFNFAFITTLVLVTIITQKINGGISEFQKGIADAFVPATNTGLAFIDGVSANAQTSGVLSNDAFLGFGAGGFGETISVCAVLGINLAIIYFAFDSIANLIDTNIQAVGKAVGGAVGKNLQNFRKADSLGQGLAMMGQDAFKYGKMAATGNNGLIADAGGAAAKLGNSSVKLGAKGINSSFKFATNKDGYRTNQLGRLNRTVSNPLSDLAAIASNPGRSLKNTTFDMLGIKNRETNDAQIADYNKKKSRNGGEPLTKEEEEKQIKRLELAKNFEEEDKKNAQQSGDSNIRNARLSTDPAVQADVAALDASKIAMDFASSALEQEKIRLQDFTDQLKNFQQSNGYTDATQISDMKLSDQVDARRLRTGKQSLETSVANLTTDSDTKITDFNSKNKELRGKTNGIYNDDIILNTNRNIANITNQQTQTKADLVNAKPNLTTTTVNLVDRYTSDATKIKGDLDGYAGNKSYAFKDEAAFQEDTAKRLEKTQSIQEQQLDATRKQTEALERLFNSGRTPPPGP